MRTGSAHASVYLCSWLYEIESAAVTSAILTAVGCNIELWVKIRVSCFLSGSFTHSSRNEVCTLFMCECMCMFGSWMSFITLALIFNCESSLSWLSHLSSPLLPLFVTDFIWWVNVLPVSVYLYHVYAWSPWRLEESIRFPWTRITVVSYHMGAGNWT